MKKSFKIFHSVSFYKPRSQALETRLSKYTLVPRAFLEPPFPLAVGVLPRGNNGYGYN